MKKITKILCIFAIALLAAGAALAQARDLTGTWQGTLQAPGQQLRTVLKVTKGDNGALKGVFYSIDQGGQGIGVTSITLEGSTVKCAIAPINGSYTGTLSADGNTIDGTWTQGNNPLPLTLMRTTPDTAWALPAPPKPMTNPDPTFAVATIKLDPNPERPGFGFRVPPGGRQFSTINTSLSNLITFAYGLHSKQVVGGPDWISQTKYDLVVQPDGEGVPNDKQWKIMMQKLLADRFQLTFHREKRDISVYTLVVAKAGSKLTPSGGDPNGLPGIGFRALGNLFAVNASMADFAGVMQTTAMDKPVVDNTGLKGRFDFTLKWTPDEFQFPDIAVKPPAPADTADAPPDLYTAIQQQLGLRLDSTKAPTDVIVIDKVTQPSAN